ncbi:MAG: hypothetical protein ACOCYQ_03620 [Alkalispirochaeta sp.]
MSTGGFGDRDPEHTDSPGTTGTDRVESARLVVVGGHYGVGKSECSVAMALHFVETEPDRPVTLIDLDVVNPYFRSREARKILEDQGVRVIGNSLGIDTGVDLPAIPGTVAPTLRDPSRRVIVDLGGDPVGARALRQFRPSIPTEDTLFLYVFNRYREQNRDAATAFASMRSIENVAGLECGGILNNTHLLGETTCDHLTEGDRVVRELATRAEVPVVYHAATPELLNRCTRTFAGDPLPIRTALRQSWMNTGNDHTTRRK